MNFWETQAGYHAVERLLCVLEDMKDANLALAEEVKLLREEMTALNLSTDKKKAKNSQEISR